jgi:chorismate mutase
VTPDDHVVNEIAAALREVRIPVLIENASEPDVRVWARALESLNGAGVQDMAAVHRGFLFSHGAVPSYQPKWEIPIELMRLAPHLPMLCDLTAAKGDSEFLSDVAQAAMDLDMNGLLAEVHAVPAESSSLPNQGLTVLELESLLSAIEVRQKSPSSTTVQSRIDELRKVIDSLDWSLLDKLRERQEVVDQIAKLKEGEDVAVLQLERWREIVRSRLAYGRELGLDDELVQMVFEVIHNHAIARQREMLKQRSAKYLRSE